MRVKRRINPFARLIGVSAIVTFGSIILAASPASATTCDTSAHTCTLITPADVVTALTQANIDPTNSYTFTFQNDITLTGSNVLPPLSIGTSTLTINGAGGGSILDGG